MIFPSLQPSSRSFTAGNIPVSVFRSISGKETRVVTGDTPSAHAIGLGFNNVDEAVANSVLSHWYAMQGTALAFKLPSDVWAGWIDYAVGSSADQLWRYSNPPEITAVSPAIMSISVQLVSVLDG